MKTNSQLEVLESRIAPAGIVTVLFTEATGELKITGDDLSNQVNIYQTGKDTYRIEGFGGTGIGNANTSFKDISAKLKSLSIDGGLGSDTISASNFSTLESAKVIAKVGGDSVTLSNLTTKKNVDLELADGASILLAGLKTNIGGDANVTVGLGGGDFQITGYDANIKGALTVTGGVDYESVGLASENLNIGKGIVFTTGGGGGSLDVSAGHAVIGKGPAAAIALTTGIDGGDLNFGGGPTYLKGALNFTGGAGFDSINAFASELKIDGDLAFVGNAGGSSLDFGSNVTKMKGAVNIDLGADSGSVGLSGTHTLEVGKNLTVKGGTDFDSVSLTGGSVNLKGALTFDLGAGSSNVNISGNNLTIGNGLKLTGGNGSDSLNVGGTTVTVKGGITLAGNDGGDSFRFNATTLKVSGAVDATCGGGNDSVEFSATKLTINDALNIKGEADGDTFSINGSKAVLKKGFTFAGNDGVNGVYIGTQIFDSGGDVTFSNTGTSGSSFDLTSDSIKLAKLTITGEGGDDFVSISGDGTIKGDVTIDLKGANGNESGSQDVFLAGNSGIAGNLKLGGKLTVKSAASNPDPLNPVVNDSFNAYDVAVMKAVEILLGAADSIVSMENFTAGDTFNLDTSAGDDYVEIDRSNAFGPSLFKKLATIQLGAGDDTTIIGGPSIGGALSLNNTATFKDGASIDGGTGTDESNDFTNALVNTGLVAADRKNFESVVA